MRRVLQRLVRLMFSLVVIFLALGRRPPLEAPQPEDEHRSTPVASMRGPFARGLIAGAALLALLLGVGGAFVLVAGVVPMRASAGHWAITSWFLDFAKRRSIATYTLATETPPNLHDPALVIRGATYFEIGCRPCHGSPDLRRPQVVERMLPAPPYLPGMIARWQPVELFYIVKHGQKFTGMPAWPVDTRDDEVWAMVAFLLVFRTLDDGGYQQLARGSEGPDIGEAPLEDLSTARPVPLAIQRNCSRCHGTDGQGRRDGAFPRLAGQRPEYLAKSLAAFASGRRSSGVMMTALAGVDEEVMKEVALYYSNLAPSASTDEARAGSAAGGGAGETIATRGIPSHDVPACVKCHGPAPHARNATYPSLAGQDAVYLTQQLQLFKSGVRGGTEYQHIMRRVAMQLTTEQMRDVARFYSELR